MIGSAGTLVDRKGGYLIPKLEKTTTTKTYTVIVPQNTIIAADNITIITGSEYLTKVVNGYAANKQEYTTVKFSILVDEPITIYNGKSILYVEYTKDKLWTDTSNLLLFQTIPNMRINGNICTLFGKHAIKFDNNAPISVLF